jgi:hypothetical protein
MNATRIDASPNTKRIINSLAKCANELVPCAEKILRLDRESRRQSSRVVRFLYFWKEASVTTACMRVLPVV